MYTVIIRPIIEATVWWEVMNKAMNKNKLNKVRRLVSKGITGAIRSDARPATLEVVHKRASGKMGS